MRLIGLSICIVSIDLAHKAFWVERGVRAVDESVVVLIFVAFIFVFWGFIFLLASKSSRSSDVLQEKFVHSQWVVKERTESVVISGNSTDNRVDCSKNID